MSSFKKLPINTERKEAPRRKWKEEEEESVKMEVKEEETLTNTKKGEYKREGRIKKEKVKKNMKRGIGCGGKE